MAGRNYPEVRYAVEPEHMKQAIEWYLTPVVDKLNYLAGQYSQAHAEVKAAHDAETPGWFGGEGHGDVKAATSSFLNEVTYQLELLGADQAELAKSLTDYRTMLQGHLTWARETELKNTEMFNGILRDLEERSR